MTQSTPCPQQTGTFTLVLASAQALGKEGGVSNSTPALALLLAHRAQGAETKHLVLPRPAGCSQAARDSWTLLEDQRYLHISASPPAVTEGVKLASIKHHFAETQVTPSSSCSLRYQATP